MRAVTLIAVILLFLPLYFVWTVAYASTSMESASAETLSRFKSISLAYWDVTRCSSRNLPNRNPC